MTRIFQAWTVLLVAAVLVSMSTCELTANERASVLGFVNYLRKSTVPKSADMNGLLWDSNLEYLAQKAANSCVFQHNYQGEYASLGETLYRGGNPNFTHILMFMFLERENYDHKTGQCNNQIRKYSFFNTCGHYLQIASAGVNKVGCGIQLCDGNYLAACEFDRQYTSPPYQTGESGTKCGNGYATYYKDGLCYAIMYGQTPPVPGPFECKLSCLNYGTLVKTPFCQCTCPSGFFGVRCETKNQYFANTIPNDCKAQAVTCMNGGTPTMSNDTKCNCACPSNYRGDNCEENIKQMESSIFVHFGGQTIYQSYYPVDVALWNSSELRTGVKQNLTDALNTYCTANFTSCCPNSNQTVLPVSIEKFVTTVEFYDTDNYPTQAIDGTLIAAVHYRLNDSVAAVCNSSSSVYATKGALTEAWKLAESGIRSLAAVIGLQVVRFE